MKHIALGFEIESFDKKEFSFPVDDSKSLSMEIFNCPVAEYQISLFIASMLKYNDLDLNKGFIKKLGVKDELALGGGLVFINEEKVIFPSCCADFQDWKENLEHIKEKKSTWMGHDPDPGVEYSGEEIIVWSDDKTKSESYFISFNQKELRSFETNLKEILTSFLTTAEIWASKYFADEKEKFLINLSKYLLVEGNEQVSQRYRNWFKMLFT
ncbi:MAG: hypothetical protein OEM02_10850 [Desulfobulbaceae bacterium]|nr:hypothetical protein [Desulfobulbaceae bacterium]